MPIFRISDKNILFMHVPKAGGTSVERWLGTHAPVGFHFPLKKYGLPCPPQHFHAEMIEALFGPGFFDYSFAVVRNPFWRLLSEYNYRMSHRRRRERIFPMPSFDRWVRGVLRRYQADPFIYSNHIRPQVEFLIEGTEVFRLESELPKLQHRLATLCSIKALPEIPVVNRSTARENAISEATAQTLCEFYREDFERFGYSPDSFTNKPE